MWILNVIVLSRSIATHNDLPKTRYQWTTTLKPSVLTADQIFKKYTLKSLQNFISIYGDLKMLVCIIPLYLTKNNLTYILHLESFFFSYSFIFIPD